MDTLRVAIITNIPTPYRDGVYDHLSQDKDLSVKVIYCNHTEPNRNWKKSLRGHKHVFLESRQISHNGQYIHFSMSAGKYLSSFDPHVVITSGYGPIMMSALLWAKLRGCHHIVFTDGTITSEENLSYLHRLARVIFFRFSSAFIGASNRSLELFRSYGIDRKAIFKSCLCVNNSLFQTPADISREFDILFVGQMIDRKMPLFFAEVAEILVKTRGSCKALILGSGPLLKELESRLIRSAVEYKILGFIQPNELPQYYAKAKLFLFPTEWDPWGVVANEACAAGLPVLTTSQAGVAGELVLDGQNGFVIPPTPSIWAGAVSTLLDNDQLYTEMSNKSVQLVSEYSIESASTGIKSAIMHCFQSKP